MPFPKYIIEPVFLSRKALPPDKQIDDELEAVSNKSLVQVLRQLASLVNFANNIFIEVAANCETLTVRTTRLQSRIESLGINAFDLDAKKTRVPLGDLHSFSLVQDHFQSSIPASWSYFSVAQRPPCVLNQCGGTRELSSPLLRIVEHYEGYRKNDSLLFCLPIIGDSKWKEHLDIETRKPAQAILCSPEDDESGTDFVAGSPVIVRQWPLRPEELERLPSPEEQMLALALEHPSALVQVNTNTFHRMATLRRSLMHPDFLIKRRTRKRHGKRRNTICGEASTSSKDQHVVSKSSQTEPSSMPTTNEPKASSSGLVSFLRDRAKRHSVVPTERNSLYETVEIIPPPAAAPTKEKRFSLLSLRNTETKDKKDTLKSKGKTKDDKKLSTLAAGSSNSSGVKSRSFLPISTLSAAMSVAVKLRGTIGRPSKKGTGEDQQSSSGNWSATSSNRGSVDSDHRAATTSTPEPGSITSQSSIEKDSMLSDVTHQEGRSQDGMLTGYTSDASTSLVNSWQPVKICNRSNTLTPENHYSDATGSSTPRVISPYATNQSFMDSVLDDEESVYSVDTDGYYTSMHTDSGLKNMSPNKSRCRRESGSSVSTLGNVSLNSILSRSAMESSPPSSMIGRRLPPIPPPRVCTSRIPAPSESTLSPSPTESDRETKERLRAKTKIDPSRYPSMCSVSPDTSDEDRKALLNDIEKTFGSQGLSSLNQKFPHLKNDLKGIAMPSTDKPLITESPVINIQRLTPSISAGELKSFQPRYSTRRPSDFNEKLCASSLTTDEKKADLPATEKKLSSFSASLSPLNPPKSVTPAKDSPNNKKQSKDNEQVKSPCSPPVVPKMPLIPLKYAQHITVTPVFRDSKLESDSFNPNSQVIRPKLVSPLSETRPNSALGHSMSSIPRPIAKVTLDPDGKVIFSSNSLGRRRDGHPMNYVMTAEQRSQRKYSTLPTRLRQNSVPPIDRNLSSPVSNSSTVTSTSSLDSTVNKTSENKTMPVNNPVCRLNSSPAKNPFVKSRSCVSTSSLDSLVPKPSQVSPTSGSSELLSPSPLHSMNSESSDSLGKRMSTEDLFAAIHQCRKKLNLKSPSTGLDSAHCTSPMSPQSRPQSRNELAESGCLTPRKDSTLEVPGTPKSEPRRQTMAMDRMGTKRQTTMRDFKLLLLHTRSAPGPTRKSATELLRASTPTPGRTTPVKSPNLSGRGHSSLPASPCKELLSPPISNNNNSDDWHSPSSSTIPFKRNSRGRSSLQSRYDCPLYPPILEECKEDSEQASESFKHGSYYSFCPIAKQPTSYSVAVPRTPHKPATSTWV